ncbi:hypothetical protein BD324DRAFT_641891 [Kockovaella imperatae]|uniref:chitin deacetylase n=1 Tax=Kockovaella imperatae TaxID=4999 RepID=A0A1Y1UK04_9TREE|nr:hypothetical protein BD324DRAFT_641891 [Kockovaella imperatae]ORX37796.1 hypothetical protein BD324DRAFT_641891 [Kockovaella imperatae]
MRSAVTVSVLSLAYLQLSAAHVGCNGQELIRRQTVQSEGQSTNPNTECQGYSYAPLEAIQQNYPGSWVTASILPNDTEALALYNKINTEVTAQFPNIQPHGTHNGSFAGVQYNSSDPDCWWTWSNCVTPAASTGLQPDWASVPEPETFGLTFDDGPNCAHNLFYDFLQENNQKATMFYIGSNIYDSPLQGLRGFADGHHICVHTWSHQYMTSFTNEVAFAELYYTRKIITELFGVTPLCWRPPYGDVDNRIRAIAKGLNLTTVMWVNDTADWTLDEPNTNNWPTVDANYQYVIDGASNGMWSEFGPIVLAHELTNMTMTEAMTYYPKIKAAFRHVVPLASAFNVTSPYAEGNVSYPDFKTYTSGQTNQTICQGRCDAVGETTSSSATSATGQMTATTASTHSASVTASAKASSVVVAKTGGAKRSRWLSGGLTIMMAGVCGVIML